MSGRVDPLVERFFFGKPSLAIRDARPLGFAPTGADAR